MATLQLPHQISPKARFDCPSSCLGSKCCGTAAAAPPRSLAVLEEATPQNLTEWKRLQLRRQQRMGKRQPRHQVLCRDGSPVQEDHHLRKKWRSKWFDEKSVNGSITLPISAPADQPAGTGIIMRPRRIILVRHGQSLGNIDESYYTRIPDSKIPLTKEGWYQAVECGSKIRRLIEGDECDDWRTYFYVSPYKRTLQTLRGIGTAFERSRIAGVREEPRLREQDFGNFQDREKMRVEKEIRLRYGRFFYRFPNGESASDVYDRITAFRETLRSDIDFGRFHGKPGARTKDMNLVLVSHGLTLRVFLMRWYKWTVKEFEGLYNFGNTGMVVMELGPGGRYSLLVHHSPAELKALGMTDEMIEDQEWQKHSKPGELNDNWASGGSSFFGHFDAMEQGLPYKDVPADVGEPF